MGKLTTALSAGALIVTLGTSESIKNPNVSDIYTQNTAKNTLQLRRDQVQTPEWFSGVVPQDVHDRVLRRSTIIPDIQASTASIIQKENNTGAIQTGPQGNAQKESKEQISHYIENRIRNKNLLEMSEAQREYFATNLKEMPPMLDKGYDQGNVWLSNEIIVVEENKEIIPTAEELQYAVEKFKPEAKDTFFSKVSAQQIIDICEKYKLSTGEVLDPFILMSLINSENRFFTDGNEFDVKANNPGEMRLSKFAIGYSEHGNGTTYAVFPDLPTGIEAIANNFVNGSYYVKAGVTGIGEVKELYTPWGDGDNNPRESALITLDTAYEFRVSVLERRLSGITDPVLRQLYQDQIDTLNFSINEIRKLTKKYETIQGEIPEIVGKLR